MPQPKQPDVDSSAPVKIIRPHEESQFRQCLQRIRLKRYSLHHMKMFQ